MPNLITQYDNGTFESVVGTWDAQIYNVNSFERSTDFAKSGTYSVKIFTEGHQNFLPYQFMQFEFPGVDGQEYQFKVNVRVDSGIGDALYIFAQATVFPGSLENQQFPVRASDAKSQWAELVINFKGKAVDFVDGDGPLMRVLLMFAENMQGLKNAAPGLFTPYINIDDFIDTTQVGNAVFPNNALIYVDAASAELKAIEALPDPQVDGRKLYYVENVFLLSIGSQVYNIKEPIKWDQVLIETLFDESTSRYRFEFSDKDVVLEFDAAAGYEILDTQYKKHGSNADVRLKFGERVDNVLTIHFEAQINFDDGYEGNLKTIKATCERRSFAQKLKSRFDTKVDLFSANSVDGNVLNALGRHSLFLHPRLFNYVASLIYNIKVPLATTLDKTVFAVPGGDAAIYRTTVPFKITSNNIQGFQEPSVPDGLLIYSGVTLDNGVDKRVLSYNLRVKYTVTTTNSTLQLSTSAAITRYTGISTGTPIPAESIIQTQPLGIVGNTYHLDFILSGELILTGDDSHALIISVLVPINESFTTISDFAFEDVNAFYMNVREKTVFESSKIKVVKIFEALNRQLEIITNVPNVLKSNFFGRTDLGYTSNGCGSNHFLFNGLMCRGFDDRSFNMSTKENFNSTNGIWCMGMSIERDNFNNEFVRWEPLEYFFRPVRLMTLKIISDYSERPASQYIFNELEFGFKKFPTNNQADSLQDWMTRLEMLTPLKVVKNKLSKVIDWILSSYYIEYTRQEAFRTNPVNTYETDNDTFMVEHADSVSQRVGIPINIVDQKIVINEILPIVDGDEIVISGTTSNDGTYIIDDIEIPFLYNQIFITITTPLLLTDEVNASATITFPETTPAKRNEGFTTIQGIDFKESVYNLNHHLKRIMLRWAKVFQSGWAFYVKDAVVFQYFCKFVAMPNNKMVVTKTTDTCQEDRDVADRADEDILAMDRPMFGNNIFEFNAPLTWDSVTYLRKCFEGRSPDNKNYGYISFLKKNGEIGHGYILQQKFNPVKQMCKFTLIEKY